MDYSDELKEEARNAHSVFHEFVLLVSESDQGRYFGFFEGDDDPSFYSSHIFARIRGAEFVPFICNGRSEVLKVSELVRGDGRCGTYVMYFIDKDHVDIMVGREDLGEDFFRTRPYSIENYLVSRSVLQRYWVERLHLSPSDARLEVYLDRFDKLKGKFYRRMRLLMALVLLGRGIDGRREVKLNLNNVQLDKLFEIDVAREVCIFKTGAAKHFILSTNLKNCDPVGSADLRAIFRSKLLGMDPDLYVRGKYVLWFFWKILTVFTSELSDREKSRTLAVRRATPNGNLTLASCVESLSTLLSCPPELADFLDRRFAINHA